MRIALTGNPNSGKTTLYNALTGRMERVGNWAGVTVEKKESSIKSSYTNGKENLIAIDLPGAYSMSPFTSEESITSSYVKNEKPDVIINIVDATNLSRSLFFTTQLLELGIPVVVALNKSDINQKKGTVIDIRKLSQELHCPVIETISISTTNNGLKEVVESALSVFGKSQESPYMQGNIDLHNKKMVEEADRKRFEFVNLLVSKVEERKILTSDNNFQDKIDAVLAHKWLGIPFFVAIMWAVFAISQTYLGPFIADYLVSLIESFQGWVGTLVEGASPFLQALLVDGIIGGFGAVVGFLPLVMVMYFLIALLEDCGYMARVAVVMDRFFKKVGLSGKSIIPMVIGTGCAIPGVMACRTIRDERERRTTAMLTPFMPCGAKLPVIALFAGVFFQDASWVGTLMYFVGIILIFVGALVIQKITGHKFRKSFFILELPEYKVPSIKRAFLSMMARAKSFIIKAATIILVCNALVQIMQTFNWNLQVVAEGAENTSILASIASPFAFLLIPLGFGLWQLAAAAITGFIAKENVVGTLAVVYGITNFIDVEELALVSGSSEVATIMGITSVAALAYLMFNLFTPPCFAAIGAMNAEMQDKKWLFGGIALQFGAGYIVAFIVYQFGTLLTTGIVGSGFIPGLIVVSLLILILVILMNKGDKKVDDYSLGSKNTLNV
ncbi:ferrous iron transporter B [Anaerorhabdus sp.]|uniref:ferrous iron transporter B n=1 Tax=Anaerorhabdus sp. TaxID=1872524 RepID=UPI002B2078D6|nr:ferrous iron transporter B [Anaerorhabdus sp.]MEA4875972.1 ferrous iron transporter B [Anaerorhabdus sp.]